MRFALRMLLASLCLALAGPAWEQLPQPLFNWALRLDSAVPAIADRAVESLQVEVASHSVQLLTARADASGGRALVHAAGDAAIQPEKAPRPMPPAKSAV